MWRKYLAPNNVATNIWRHIIVHQIMWCQIFQSHNLKKCPSRPWASDDYTLCFTLSCPNHVPPNLWRSEFQLWNIWNICRFQEPTNSAPCSPESNIPMAQCQNRKIFPICWEFTNQFPTQPINQQQYIFQRQNYAPVHAAQNISTPQRQKYEVHFTESRD